MNFTKSRASFLSSSDKANICLSISDNSDCLDSTISDKDTFNTSAILSSVSDLGKCLSFTQSDYLENVLGI